jgi:hypothetical protein
VATSSTRPWLRCVAPTGELPLRAGSRERTWRAHTGGRRPLRSIHPMPPLEYRTVIFSAMALRGLRFEFVKNRLVMMLMI